MLDAAPLTPRANAAWHRVFLAIALSGIAAGCLPAAHPQQKEPPKPEPQWQLAGCASYFDGCNACRVRDARIVSCTQDKCEQRSKPHCVEPLRPPGAVTVLRGTPMRGPFSALDQVCATVTCSAESLSYGPGEAPPKPSDVSRDCRGLEPGMAAPPSPFVALKLQSIDCRLAGIRDSSRTYRLLATTADGIYLSEPIVAALVNDKYCDEETVPDWEVRSVRALRGDAVVLRIRSRIGCVSCNKQGWEAEGQELVVVLAKPPGQAPVLFAPVSVASRYHQERDQEGDPGAHCPTIDERSEPVLSWSDAGELTVGEVEGPARKPRLYDPPRSPSPATYRFEL